MAGLVCFEIVEDSCTVSFSKIPRKADELEEFDLMHDSSELYTPRLASALSNFSSSHFYLQATINPSIHHA